jgi:DNA-binding transcriptional LysR family regulator
MAIRNKNLNLIPILQSLLHEESVVKAADNVGLSQPAMSSALARLRDLLGDPLLVRVGRSMRLTPRAQYLRFHVGELCAQIDALFQPQSFDPKTAQLSFRIAATDYLAYLISRILLPKIATEAPGVRIQFVDVPGDAPAWMAEGTIDMAVCGEFGYWPELQSEFLFRERYVATVARHHPLAARSHVTSDDLAPYPSPGVIFDPELSHGPRDKKWVTGLRSLDDSPQVTTMGQFAAVLLALNPPFVGRAPASLIEVLQEDVPLHLLELSGEASEFDTCMFWTKVTDQANEHIWLRNLIRSCLEQTISRQSRASR